MTARFRTIFAFLTAPAVAALIVAAVEATIRKPGVGPTWLAAFLQMFILASLTSYALSYTVGTLTFLILKKARRESLKAYTTIGVLCGTVYGIVVTSGTEFSIRTLAVVAFLASISGAVAFTFAAIRGNPKTPNQSATDNSGAAPRRV
jgi:hypothetical protein